MSITATGPILMLMALYVFFFKPGQLIYYAAFFAPFSATAIFNLTALSYKTGGLGLTPAMAMVLLFFTSQFAYGYITRSTRISTGHLIQLGLIVVFAGMVVTSMTINGAMHPLASGQYTHTTYLMIGLFTTMLFSLEFVRDDRIEIVIRVIRASAIFVSLWGLLQLVCSIVHVPYPDFMFNNSNSDAADMFAQALDSSFARISSVAVEPSVMAASLLHFVAFSLTIIARDARFRTRYWISAAAITTGVLVLSTSSTAYFGLAVTGLLLALQTPTFALLIGAPLAAILAGVIATVPRVRDMLLDATIHKQQSFSYLDRSAGVAHDMAIFWQHPLFGAGWNAAANFNGIATLLCNVGILGAVVFLVCGLCTLTSLTIACSDASPEDWKFASYAAGARNALIVAAACGVTSGMKYVFLDDWVFWGLAIALASRLNLAHVSAPALWARASAKSFAVARVSPTHS